MNRREEQIRALKTRTANLSEGRLKECLAKVVEAYKSESVVDYLGRVVELREREPSDFHVLTNSERRRLSHFNDPSYQWDFYCRQLGRSIAIAEERYIFEELDALVPSDMEINAARPDFQPLFVAVAQLLARGHTPDAICAPIPLYVSFTGDPSIKIDWSGRPEVVIGPRGLRIPLFWSSGLASLPRFVVFDKSCATWRVKLDPETGDRLTVAIGEPESYPESVVFLAETVVKYEVDEPSGFAVIEVVGKSQEDFEMDRTEHEGE